ncbi:MAG: delta-60 repeat domain-containing protein, partial [Chitinophagaceae bacterium]|nr:delta-60 repeat domain-containing protein [Chitinophagaceae bacterium]
MSFRFFRWCGILLLVTNATLAQFSQPGELDTTFNYGRPARFFVDPSNPGPGDGANNQIRVFAFQPDGKLLIGGDFTTYNGVARSRIARLHADGTLDASFNPGTGADWTIHSFAVQADGKVLFAGDFFNYDGTRRNMIARLLPDGRLDTTFSPGTGANGTLRTCVLQPDGKVLIGGYFTRFNGTPRHGLARLLPDGSLDTTFNPGTGTDNTVFCLALQPDGKVLIGGDFRSFNGVSRNYITRLHLSGEVDTTFDPGEGPNAAVLSMALQHDGRILIVGDFNRNSGVSRNRIARLNTDGKLDISFNPGIGTNGRIQSVLLQSDKKVLIGGLFSNYNGIVRNHVARVNTDGSLDTNFSPSTRANSMFSAFTLQSDGKILIASATSANSSISRRNRVVRMNADGSTDADFNPGKGGNSIVQSLVVQPDGKLLISGSFTAYNTIPTSRIARLNKDGDLDSIFNMNAGANGDVISIALQPDGKMLIGGGFTRYNGVARFGIGRLHADGRIDTSFDPGTGVNGTVTSVVLQPDGKVLIGGNFSSYNGTYRNCLARLNSDGSLDTSFAPGSGPNNIVYSIVLQPDGKVLIGGAFTNYNGVTRGYIARLLANGALDVSFNSGTGANAMVLAAALQADGKVLIGGWFTSYGSNTGRVSNRIVRLNADGSIDTGFNMSSGPNHVVYSIAIQPDGKLLLAGGFSNVNGVAANRIARLNSNGSLDTSFILGVGPNDWVGCLAVQANGQLLIGGAFTNYEGTGPNHIARLNADGSLDTRFNLAVAANDVVFSHVLQPDGKLIIGGSFTNYNATSRNRIARLHTDGSLDESFKPGTGADQRVFSLALQPDGKVLLGGDFSSYNGTARGRIARLHADGSLDDSFNPGTGAGGSLSTPTVFSLALQPDGRVLVGGAFTSYNGTARSCIARLNADGSLDMRFNPGTGLSGTTFPSARSLALLPDGRVLLGGSFTSYNGTPRNHLVRLHPDGSLDASFNPGAGPNGTVLFVAPQLDGKVLIGGDFISYDGRPRNRIARLHADGSLDTSFNPGLGADNRISSMALQPDGKVLIGGAFTQYDGTARSRLALLQADGRLDSTFSPGTGVAGISSFVSVYSLSFQSGNTVLIGGDFNSYNGVVRPHIARVHAGSVACSQVPKVMWTGAVSNDWHTAGNWSMGFVPTGATHVIIGPSANMCIISTSDAAAYSVQVLDGGRLEQRHGY